MNRMISVYILSSIALSFVCENGGEHLYTFEERFVQHITLASPEEYSKEEVNYKDNYLTGLNSEERMQLCKTVHSDLELPFISDEYVFGSEVYHYTLFKEDDYYSVGIKCPTNPRAYLMYSTSNQVEKKNIIVAFVNPYIDRYSFDVEVVQKMEPNISSSEVDNNRCTHVGANSSRSWEDEVETDLSYISPEDEDRWNLCFIATKRIHRNIRFLRQNQALNTEPQSYKFNKGGVVAFNAIDCQTSPSMYLRVKITDSRYPVIKMMFVEADLKESELPQ